MNWPPIYVWDPLTLEYDSCPACSQYNYYSYTYPVQVQQDQENNTQEVEGDEEPEYVLSEDVIEMFAKTEARRKERRKLQDERKKQNLHELKNPVVEKVQKSGQKKQTVIELNNQKRKREELYGNNENMKTIEALEASLNSFYDTIIDLKRPKLWPTVSLADGY